MRAALVHDKTKEVQNIILLPDDYDAKKEGAYLPPEGCSIVMDHDGQAEIGGTHEGNHFVKPTPPEVSPPEPTLEERVAALEAAVGDTSTA